MGWESRSGGRRYYYRAKKVGRRVVKTYLGGPGVGEHAESEDAQRTALQAEQRERDRDLVAVFDRMGPLLDLVDAAIDAVTREAFEESGFYRHHRGEWRRRRGADTGKNRGARTH